MSTHAPEGHPHKARETVIILGGKGGLQARYREAVERFGYELRHYEVRIPPKQAPSRNRIAMVIVMVTMISHPLMAQARALAGSDAAIIYLKSPSISAVRDTVARRAPLDRKPASALV